MLFWADLLYTPAMIAKRRLNDAELAVEATAEGNSGELARVKQNTFLCHKSSFGRGLVVAFGLFI